MDDSILIIARIAWGIVGGLAMFFASRRKGHNPWVGTVLGVLAGALGVGIVLLALIAVWMFAPARRKKCPRCAEKVRFDDLVCKHCGYEFGSTRGGDDAHS